MSNFPYEYPEDLTGSSPRNLVQNEIHKFPTRDERIFVPAGGPFYTESLRVVDNDTGKELEPITQYKAVHLQNAATLDSGKQVCCVIIIEDATIASASITYQVAGGKYGEVVTTLQQIIDEIDWDKLKQISWGSDVYGKPDLFPASPHKHPADEFTGWMRTVRALHNIHQALIAKDTASWESVYDFIDRKVNQVTNNSYTQEEVDNKIVASTFDPDDIKLVSKTSGNELKSFRDGIYYNDNFRLVNKVGDYTLQKGDIANNTLIRLISGGQRTVTVPKMSPEPAIGSKVVISSANGKVRLMTASGVSTNPATGSKGIILNKVADYMTLVYTGANNWNCLIATDVDMTLIEDLQKQDGLFTTEINRLKTSINNILNRDLVNIRRDVNYIKTVDIVGIKDSYAALKKKVDDLIKNSGGGSEIPVGGLFVTTVTYNRGADVTKALGYGVWQPYAEGQALVGMAHSSKASDWTKEVGNLYGEETHTLVPEELPSKGFKMRKAGPHGARNHGGRGTTYAGGGHNSMAAVSSTESGWKDRPHNIVQPSVVIGAWVRVDGGYKPRQKKKTDGVGDVVATLDLKVKNQVVRIDSRWNSYYEASFETVSKTGLTFTKVPANSSYNFKNVEGYEKDPRHWLSQLIGQRVTGGNIPRRYIQFPVPSWYNSSKHEIVVTSKASKDIKVTVSSSIIEIGINWTYVVLKSGSTTLRSWHLPITDIAIKVVVI